MKSFFAILASLMVVAFGQPAWAPFLAPFAATIGYALFWNEMLRFEKKSHRFLVATGWYLLVQAVQLSWLFSLTPEYKDIFIVLGYLGLIVWLALQFALLSLFINPRSVKRIVTIASMWTLLEWVRQHYFLCGFSLNPAGMALTPFSVPMQLASVWGVLGLSFWVVLTNLFALRGWIKRKKRTLWIQFGALALFPYLFGIIHIASNEKEGKSLSVGLVQTGLFASEKIPIAGYLSSFVSPSDQWQRILRLIKSKETYPFDLVVLPESAVPFGFDPPLYSLESAQTIFAQELGGEIASYLPSLTAPFARKKERDGKEYWRVSNAFFAQGLANYLKAEVIVGLDAEDRERKEHYNAGFHFLPGGGELSRYEKRILLPVAEYLPFQQWGLISKQYGFSEFFTSGREAKVFKHTIPFSISICYEETFPYLIREGRQKGAALFVNLTNDNWYPSSRLARQHYDHGIVRTVENGVPLLRACNTGITAVVDSLGRTQASLGESESAGILVAKANLHHYKTLYTFWGDGGILSLCILFLSLNIVSIWKKPCSK